LADTGNAAFACGRRRRRSGAATGRRPQMPRRPFSPLAREDQGAKAEFYLYPARTVHNVRRLQLRQRHKAEPQPRRKRGRRGGVGAPQRLRDTEKNKKKKFSTFLAPSARDEDRRAASSALHRAENAKSAEDVLSRSFSLCLGVSAVDSPPRLTNYAVAGCVVTGMSLRISLQSQNLIWVLT
jgi:hypothetical protein